MRPDVSFGSPRWKNGNARPKRKSLLTSKHAMPCERPLQSSQSPQNLVHAPEGGALIASGFTARVGRAGGARTSRPIQSDRRVKVLKFDACVWGCELPIGLGVVDITVVLPSGDFLDEGLFVGNPAVEALGCQDAEFGLRQIEPTAVLWSVVPFEALHQPPGFDGRKGFVE